MGFAGLSLAGARAAVYLMVMVLPVDVFTGHTCVEKRLSMIFERPCERCTLHATGFRGCSHLAGLPQEDVMHHEWWFTCRDTLDNIQDTIFIFTPSDPMPLPSEDETPRKVLRTFT